MGLLSSVIARLIFNKSFLLIREGIKKNMVHFLFGSKRIRVTFISRSQYYEVIVACDPTFNISMHQECAALRNEIEDTLKKASFRMNYSSYMDYQFAFECCSHDRGNHLGVVDRAESVPEVMTCLLNPDNPKIVVLEDRHLIWFGQVSIEAIVLSTQNCQLVLFCNINMRSMMFHFQKYQTVSRIIIFFFYVRSCDCVTVFIYCQVIITSAYS